MTNVTIRKTEGKNDIVVTSFHNMKVLNLKQVKISQVHQLNRTQILSTSTSASECHFLPKQLLSVKAMIHRMTSKFYSVYFQKITVITPG